MSSAPEPFTHAIASRDGLFLAHRSGFARVAEGLFFGLTLRGDDLYCFEAGDHPWVPSRLGRIVRFRRTAEGVGEREILVEGLDNGCHQIDFFMGSCFVVDTYNQQILEYDRDWRLSGTHFPVQPVRYGEAGPDYFHVNSFLGRGDSIFLLLHNGRLERPSEILEVDRAFRERRRIPLLDMACHDIVMLEDDRFLVCNSLHGSLIDVRETVVKIDALMTRGLSVGVDEIVVGSSLFGHRPVRELIPGFVTFLDRSYRRIARHHLPAAPTQIRRLDGADLSLSSPRDGADLGASSPPA
ncbi:hypothetical protein OF829_12515 [Sphingomonas sp. LB-2]|uniref:hypothetical protein n=1 Tax=Sphingomonas caeni TaxID=2984949 RepID=UPI002231F3B9|nr:hypothetical protein [Sphingomonas caeni]MCW3848065.1 hypothetical protein [Sphingomonas caeni]